MIKLSKDAHDIFFNLQYDIEYKYLQTPKSVANSYSLSLSTNYQLLKENDY
jgi:hypothetical protein